MEFLKAGVLGKTRGVKGELKVKLDFRDFWDTAKVPHVFVAQDGNKIPYFLEFIKLDTTDSIKFEGVDSLEMARALSGAEFFVNKEFLPSDISIDEGDNYNLLSGFDVFNGDTEIGYIDTVVEFPQQLMANVILPNEESVMIPLNETFILEINEEEGVIYMELPEGLI